MRKVNKDIQDVPDIFSKIEVLESWDDIAIHRRVALINDKIYKDAYKNPVTKKTESKVRDKLNIYYKNKCAYCENICKAEIEHYRPKKAVIEDNTHPGYYWLCYEWSNLLPSCRYCNTEGGKGNQFPVKGNRVTAPEFLQNGQPDKTKYSAHIAPLLDEQPYLLHPEIDEPADFLTFEISSNKDGVILKGMDSDGRGDATINICNLNRQELKISRLHDVFMEYRNSITIIFEQNRSGILPDDALLKALKIVFSEFAEKAKDNNLKFTLLRKLIISNRSNFINIFAPYIENDNQRELVIMAFDGYLSDLQP